MHACKEIETIGPIHVYVGDSNLSERIVIIDDYEEFIQTIYYTSTFKEVDEAVLSSDRTILLTTVVVSGKIRYEVKKITISNGHLKVIVEPTFFGTITSGSHRSSLLIVIPKTDIESMELEIFLDDFDKPHLKERILN